MVAERITFHIEANRIYRVHIGAHCMRSASTNQNVVRDAYTNIRDHFDWYWQEYVATGIVVGAIAIGLYGFVTAMNRWDAQIKLENRRTNTVEARDVNQDGLTDLVAQIRGDTFVFLNKGTNQYAPLELLQKDSLDYRLEK